MILWIEFGGWFQCRLATDPDPSDESRGVSGYVRAVAGEPDLDRILRLQPEGAVPRTHCPTIGVTARALLGDAGPVAGSLISGAKVELLENPKFEGRNHIVAEDGFEPIVPFHVRISKDEFLLQRRFDDAMQYPPKNPDDAAKLQTLQAGGVVISPGAIGAATGVFSLASVWKDRVARLQEDLKGTTDEVQCAALKSRIASMSNPTNARFFGARMMYSVPLGGTAVVKDPKNWLGGKPVTEKTPWPMDFWCGAWDPDALSGYMLGYLGVPLQEPGLAPGFAAMMSNPAQERR